MQVEQFFPSVFHKVVLLGVPFVICIDEGCIVNLNNLHTDAVWSICLCLWVCFNDNFVSYTFLIQRLFIFLCVCCRWHCQTRSLLVFLYLCVIWFAKLDLRRKTPMILIIFYLKMAKYVGKLLQSMCVTLNQVGDTLMQNLSTVHSSPSLVIIFYHSTALVLLQIRIHTVHIYKQL